MCVVQTSKKLLTSVRTKLVSAVLGSSEVFADFENVVSAFQIEIGIDVFLYYLVLCRILFQNLIFLYIVQPHNRYPLC